MPGWRLSTGLRNWLGPKHNRQPAQDTDTDEPFPASSPSRSDITGPYSDAAADRWSADVPVIGTKILPPDPRIMNAIGLNHSIETAIADIVDNSIDAKADKILIRFIRNADSLLALYIVDNGIGMSEEVIDRAMTVGGPRPYEAADLGHFGIGLKAASLAQARVLTVLSRASAHDPVGRRWQIESASNGFECDIVDTAYAAAGLDRDWGFFKLAAGTVVMWTDVKASPAISHPKSLDRFIDDLLMRVRQHLGLIFHRILDASKLEIGIDVEDVALGATGPRFPVTPVNPFGYHRSTRRGYPKRLSAAFDGHTLDLKCHIWPGRSHLPAFKLPGARPEQFQGFFIYRNNRLLQLGGWNGIIHADRDLQLARVELDITPQTATLFAMNAEKTRVETSPRFAELVKRSAHAGTDFSTYVEDARNAYRDSRKRTRERPKLIAPGKGFAEAVRGAIGEEYDFLPGEQPLAIRWAQLDDDVFFDIDRDEMLIRLNRRYRSAILGRKDASLNDAPLVKALIYLLAEGSFRGAFLGAKAKDNLSVWQAVLTAAAQAERE